MSQPRHQSKERLNSSDSVKLQFPRPTDLAEQLRDEGWPVPGFLLFPGDPRHIRPLVALSVLTTMLEAGGETVSPYVYFPPSDPRHVPAYVVGQSAVRFLSLPFRVARFLKKCGGVWGDVSAALERQRQLWRLQNLHPRPKSFAWQRIRRGLKIVWTPFQYLIGTAISLSSICIVFRAIQQHMYASALPPVALSVVLVVLLILIAYAEGYHVTVMTLEKADSNVFRKSHPRAHNVHSVINRNVESFVVGRQVVLTLLVFIFSYLTNFTTASFTENWLFFPSSFINVLMKTGISCSLIVLAFGQLLPQLLATAYPVHHINLPGGIVLVWLMLLFDQTGVANVGFWGAYLWRKLRGMMVKEEFGVGSEIIFGVYEDGNSIATPAASTAPLEELIAPAQLKLRQTEKNVGSHIADEASGEIFKRVRLEPIEITKLFLSLGIMLVMTGLAVRHIVMGQSGFQAPWPVLIVIHTILLIGMLYLEGMNLCVLALEKVPNEHVAVINPGAVQAHKLIIGDNGNNVRRFLLGRQFCVVWMDFLISQIGGLYSVAITVFLAQVMSQIIAATNPCYWMALPGARFMLMLSLTVEKLGVCHFGWILGHVFQWIGEKVNILRPEPFSVGKRVSMRLSVVHQDSCAA